MDLTFTDWPTADRLIWTVLTVGLAYGVGVLINGLVIRRLQRLTSLTRGAWDDALARELRKGIPLWSLLIGVRVALGYWSLDERWVAAATNLVVAFAVVSVTWAVAAVTVAALADAAHHATPPVAMTGLMRNVVRIAVVSVGVLVGLRAIGVEITPVLAALGVGGLAVALALQEPLSNLFGGLFIAMAGQISVGNYIRLDSGAEGYVDDLAWNSVRIRALAGNIILVPNAKLAQAVVTNFDLPRRDVGTSVEVTVAVGSDLALVERLAMDVATAVAREVPGGVPEAEPAIRFQAFSDAGVRCAVIVRSQQFEDQMLIRHEIVKRLHAALRGAGVEIATLRLGGR